MRVSFWPTRIWTGNLWISCPTFYHCAMVTSAFHLWQFQALSSGAEGLVVVLFWLDLGEILFAPQGIEPGTAGSLILHSITVPRWPLVFIHFNFRYIPPMHWDWWLYYSVLTCESFFLIHQELNWRLLDVFSCTLLLCQVTSVFHLWQFQVFNFGAEALAVVLFHFDLWEFLFFPTVNWTGDLLIFSHVLYCCATLNSGFQPWQFQDSHSGTEALLVVFFWLDVWEFLFAPLVI